MTEVRKEVTVGMEGGLEPRPAAKLVQLVSSFTDEEFSIEYNGKTINPKSLMSAMYLAAPYGDKFQVTVKGPEAEKALEAIEDFLSGKE